MTNNADLRYQELCQDILDNGVRKADRTGTGTISVFSRHFRHNMTEGFPLLTTKKMSLKTIATELRWFLNGDTSIRFLNERGCKIWNGDAYKKYLKEFVPPICPPTLDVQPEFYLPMTMDEFIHKIMTNDQFNGIYGNLGPIYGKQWRKWQKQHEIDREHEVTFVTEGEYVDQISDLVKSLKENPDSRRLMVTAWNVAEIGKMTLPPCHYGFQCYTFELTEEQRHRAWEANYNGKSEMLVYGLNKTREQAMDDAGVPTRGLSLLWNQRSVDTALGLPYNIASYGMLLILLANEVGMAPWELSCSMGDTHLYTNHVEPIKEQLQRQPSDIIPRLKIMGGIDTPLDGSDYTLWNYEPRSAIKFELSN